MAEFLSNQIFQLIQDFLAFEQGHGTVQLQAAQGSWAASGVTAGVHHLNI